MLVEWMAIKSGTQTAADAPHMLFNPVPLTTDIKIIANIGMKARQFINLDLCWSILWLVNFAPANSNSEIGRKKARPILIKKFNGLIRCDRPSSGLALLAA